MVEGRKLQLVQRRGESHISTHIAHIMLHTCYMPCCIHVLSICRQKNMELAVNALVAATLEENGEYSEDSGSDSDGGTYVYPPFSL